MENKHTKGELTYKVKEGIIKIRNENMSRNMAVCLFTEAYQDKIVENMKSDGKEYPIEIAEANIKRLVKCWNMHDELIEALKKALRISDLWTFDNNTAIEHEDEAEALHSMKLDFDRLIKKATE